MELVKSLTAEVEFSTLKGGRVIYAVFEACLKNTLGLKFANLPRLRKRVL